MARRVFPVVRHDSQINSCGQYNSRLFKPQQLLFNRERIFGDKRSRLATGRLSPSPPYSFLNKDLIKLLNPLAFVKLRT